MSRCLSLTRDQFRKGTPLLGKDGAFHQVLEDYLNVALEAIWIIVLRRAYLRVRTIAVMEKYLKRFKQSIDRWI